MTTYGNIDLGFEPHGRDMTDLSLIVGLLYLEPDSQAFIILDKKRRHTSNTLELGPPLLMWFNFNPSRNIYHKPSEVWYEITYPFPNFNGATFEVWERISNFTPFFTPMLGLNSIHGSKRGPWWRIYQWPGMFSLAQTQWCYHLQ